MFEANPFRMNWAVVTVVVDLAISINAQMLRMYIIASV